mmetsp:Transcript_28136/g.87183  ORF Transcript_28136/g.87183 Transcript_28136/m.87183 type:complete len:333 (-) Transcript_28136:95-1093(-)
MLVATCQSLSSSLLAVPLKLQTTMRPRRVPAANRCLRRHDARALMRWGWALGPSAEDSGRATVYMASSATLYIRTVSSPVAMAAMPGNAQTIVELLASALGPMESLFLDCRWALSSGARWYWYTVLVELSTRITRDCGDHRRLTMALSWSIWKHVCACCPSSIMNASAPPAVARKRGSSEGLSSVPCSGTRERIAATVLQRALWMTPSFGASYIHTTAAPVLDAEHSTLPSVHATATTPLLSCCGAPVWLGSGPFWFQMDMLPSCQPTASTGWCGCHASADTLDAARWTVAMTSPSSPTMRALLPIAYAASGSERCAPTHVAGLPSSSLLKK